jgi:hypothetical protein
MNLLLEITRNIINISTVTFFALCNGPVYSCREGNGTKPSAWVIAHGVGMTPMILVWASSSDMP